MRAWHLGAALPAFLGALVAADVDELRGEQLDDFAQDVFEKLEDRVVAGAVDLAVHAPVCADLERPAGARQLRIRCQCGHAVPGHLDLGHDRHVPALGVLDDLSDVILRIETAVPILPRSAPGTDAGKLGVLLNLDPPALVLGQVPMQDVHLVIGEQVDVALDELLVHEVPPAIEQHPAPLIPRIVANTHARQLPRAVLAAREDLANVCTPWNSPTALGAVNRTRWGVTSRLYSSDGADASPASRATSIRTRSALAAVGLRTSRLKPCSASITLRKYSATSATSGTLLSSTICVRGESAQTPGRNSISAGAGTIAGGCPAIAPDSLVNAATHMISPIDTLLDTTILRRPPHQRAASLPHSFTSAHWRQQR